MSEIFNTPPTVLINQINSHLSQNNLLTLPPYYNITKSCVGKQYAPLEDKWLYTRAGSMLRKIACHTAMVESPDQLPLKKGKTVPIKKCTLITFQSTYGCKKDRGNRPGKKVRASRTHLVSILNDFDKLEWITQDTHGYLLTSKGKEFVQQMIERISE